MTTLRHTVPNAHKYLPDLPSILHFFLFITLPMLLCAPNSLSSATMGRILGLLAVLPVLVYAASAANVNDVDVDASLQEHQTYIVYASPGRMPAEYADQSSWYASMVETEGDAPGGEVLYTYSNVATGFSAKMSPSLASELKNAPGILDVFPDTKYALHTTRTPYFLGLDDKSNGAWSVGNGQGDVIVGVLDTGVWPESASFRDLGMGPVPPKWKGECEVGTAFNQTNCNGKLIGARFFLRGYEAAMGPVDETKEYRSPRDNDGHGTHTASTAAGSPVQDASLNGYAKGVARGMAPKARVATYKVCWVGGCFSSDILAGLDRAVQDGVDVLSLSLGGGVLPYYRDGIALGTFTAMEKGIFVSASAGNAGPEASTLANVAPWIATIGASTLDRDFPAYAVLGNGLQYQGVSLYSGPGLPKNKFLPLIYAANATNGNTSSLCLENTLDPEKVKGKIVLCDRGISPRVEKGRVVQRAGGVGLILSNGKENGEELVADSHLIPAAAVGYLTGQKIRNYVFTSKRPVATIKFRGTVLGIKPSPVVAAFSSRGPNTMVPQLLKPDMVAPGVNILAAWTRAAGPAEIKGDARRVDFNIISGTSMSCPHVSGLAALIKSVHPDWSPAAIKSALMTTANVNDNTLKPLQDIATGKDSTPYDHGAGHVNPEKALDPGLVYDLTMQDYVDFLCALSYTPEQIGLIAKNQNVTCTRKSMRRSPGDLNYPSFSVVFGIGDSQKGSQGPVVKYRRTVTNVGPGPAVYKVAYKMPPNVAISVKPRVLRFQKENEKLTYSVAFVSKNVPEGTSGHPASFGSVTWTDGAHHVRSPVAFSWQLL